MSDRVEQFLRSSVSLDVECYPNVFLIGIKGGGARREVEGEKMKIYRITEDRRLSSVSANRIRKILREHPVLGYNIINYDLPLLRMALHGMSPAQMHRMSKRIISQGDPGWKTMTEIDRWASPPRELDLPLPVDLMLISPERYAPLKKLMGRLFERVRDLPYDPLKDLSPAKIANLESYLSVDLISNFHLASALSRDIELRLVLNDSVRLARSGSRTESFLSDSEPAITTKLFRIYLAPHGFKPYRVRGAAAEATRTDQVDLPGWLVLKSFGKEIYDKMAAHEINWSYEMGVRNKITLPLVKTRGMSLKVGTGGMHSQEKSLVLASDERKTIYQSDVEAYYPTIAANLSLRPRGTPEAYTEVFRGMMARRAQYKAEKRDIEALVLKRANNAAFGLSGNRYSWAFDPKMMHTITFVGQLSLLMLIERLEAAGLSPVSANTDGIVCPVPPAREAHYLEVCAEWERETGFSLPHTKLKLVVIRDVSNYFSVDFDGEVSSKGCFAPLGLRKSPDFNVVPDCVRNWWLRDKPFADTIADAPMRDFLKLAAVRKPGCEFRGETLGRVARFYMSSASGDCIRRIDNGGRVPGSESCEIAMDRIAEDAPPPADTDIPRYHAKAEELFRACGAFPF